LVQSIKELGILMPLLVRPHNDYEDKYEILSGHNRDNGAGLVGLDEVPVIILKGLSDDEAALIVTETNLIQRSFADLSHSERAIAIKLHMDAISKQGKRTDLLDKIKRLSNPDEIGLYPAVSISYLSPDEQNELNRLLNETSYKIDMKKAESLRVMSESKKLTNEKMEQILSGELNKKPKSKNAPPLKIKPNIYQKYFDGDTTQSEMLQIIEQLLAEYYENRKKQEGND
jgi:ParB family chromosome partitioning protein